MVQTSVEGKRDKTSVNLIASWRDALALLRSWVVYVCEYFVSDGRGRRRYYKLCQGWGLEDG